MKNLDQVLADLETVGVIIYKVKSEFCQAGTKIVGYIGDVDSPDLDISKVLKALKILD